MTTLRPTILPIALLALALAATPARAVLDVNDRGPTLDPGAIKLRVTNAGVLGNAFYDVGLSSDPSFEYPSHSGQELLNYAALWVGARTEQGDIRVSGGPILEWRPTLDLEDRVRIADHGRLGTRRLVDDDGDGRLDEELLNGKDDDGDTEIDEDLGFWSKQMLSADYVDDRPEALTYIYEGGESHRPLQLSVHQEVYGWDHQGYEGIAGLDFTITNHGTQTVRDVYIGLFADLDVRLRSDRGGHLDDRVAMVRAARTLGSGSVSIEGNGVETFPCSRTVEHALAALVDGGASSIQPVVAVVPLDHTIDPLASIALAARYARAPGKVAFRTTVFSRSQVPGQGGVPALDEQRHAALRGDLEGASTAGLDDYAVLIACGPFPTLAPGQQLQFTAALVAAPRVDSLAIAVENAIFMHHGSTLNLIPDTVETRGSLWFEGRTGLNGHEACVEPPPGASFLHDPHCPDKFCPGPWPYCGLFSETRPTQSFTQTYEHGHCIWTDADCDACTGTGGRETILRWLDPGAVPPLPARRTTPLDHAVKLEWDNLPEVLINAGRAGPSGARFLGYRVYKLADWRQRSSLLPPLENWELLAAFGPDTAHGERALASVTDTTLAFDRILYREKVYPVGRYVLTDPRVLNGFDYVYVVTTVAEVEVGFRQVVTYESPIVATFDRRVTPHAASRESGTGAWVVPNPFRARAAWDRPAVGGDGFTRHIDFMGLPRARCTIRIYTVAGDLVHQIDHDGSRGDGQVPWDLVSRSGQDIESGLYLFTVDSPLGHQVGRFVIIR